MLTYTADIGHCVLGISKQSRKEIQPNSRLATLAGERLVEEFDERLRKAADDERLPGYLIHCRLSRLESGSLLAYLGFTVDVVDMISTGVVGAGLFKFCKDYPSLKKGILEIAHDLNQLLVVSFGLFHRTLNVTLQANHLRPDDELLRDVQAAIAEMEAQARQREEELRARASLIAKLAAGGTVRQASQKLGDSADEA